MGEIIQNVLVAVLTAPPMVAIEKFMQAYGDAVYWSLITADLVYVLIVQKEEIK